MVAGFRFVHSLGIASVLHKDWTHLYSWQQSVSAQLARGVPHCPETGKGLPFQLPLSWIPEKYQYRRLASALAVSFSMTPLHPHLFYARQGRFSKESGTRSDAPVLQAKRNACSRENQVLNLFSASLLS